MANAALGLLDKNAAVYSANTKVTGLIFDIKKTVADINKAAIAQSTDASGATTTKKSAHQIAIDNAEHISVGLQAYYDDLGDHTAEATVHFTSSDFTYGSVAEISTRMQGLHDVAASITIANLAPFNIVAADITNFQSAINAYVAAAPVRTTMRATASAFTAQLNALFSKMHTQFIKLDKLIKSYKLAQSVFVASYLISRKVINLGKTQQAEELHLMPHHFESVFGMKFAEGDTFTVRNHSAVPVHVALSDVPAQMPTDLVVEVPAHEDFKLSVSADFGNKFRHWLMVHNFNDLDDAHVTIVLAHGKSQSSAQAPGQTA
jgi:hypothetical protein